MVEPAAAELTKFLPLSEPIEYEPPLPVAAIEAPDEPEDEEPLELEEPDELPEDEPPLALAAAEAALAAPAAALIKAPSPITSRPSRADLNAVKSPQAVHALTGSAAWYRP